MRNGQSSIEFMILVGAAFFFFLGLLFVIYGAVADKSQTQINTLVIDLAGAVRSEINLASTAGDGYSRSFDVPNELINQPYSISLTAGNVYVRTDDGRHAVALPITNVTGDIQKGVNIVRNVNGTVILN